MDRLFAPSAELTPGVGVELSEVATIQVPINRLTVEQATRATLRAVLDIRRSLDGFSEEADLQDQIDRATAQINANTARLRQLAAELNKNKEGSQP